MQERTRMKTLIVVVCLVCVCPSLQESFQWQSPRRKTWWAKYVSPDVFTAGRITTRQVKYAAEAGFKSILSVFKFDEEETIDGITYPSRTEEEDVATNVTGIKYANLELEQSVESWVSMETLELFKKSMESLPKPVLVHCRYAEAATFLALINLMNSTTQDGVVLDSKEFFRRSAAIGFDFGTDKKINLVSKVSGEIVTSPPPKPDTFIPDWSKRYWLMKPFYKNWFVSGQIQTNHIPYLEQSCLSILINSRRGVEPYQEEVVLLNINDRTGNNRQLMANLESSRINPDRPNTYVSPTSTTNYESNNPLEFGDQVGYNETLGEIALLGSNFEYIHTPIGSAISYSTTPSIYDEYADTWVEAGQTGNVLMQCRTGYRSTIATMLAAGLQWNKTLDWVLERGRDHGYFIEQISGTETQLALLKLVLPSSSQDYDDVTSEIPHQYLCPEKRSTTAGPTSGPANGVGDNSSTVNVSYVLCLGLCLVFFSFFHMTF